MNYFCHFIVFAYGEIKVIFMQPIFCWYPDKLSVPFQGKLKSVDLGVRFVAGVYLATFNGSGQLDTHFKAPHLAVNWSHYLKLLNES